MICYRTDNNQNFTIHYACIHYHPYEISSQIIKCKIFAPYDFIEMNSPWCRKMLVLFSSIHRLFHFNDAKILIELNLLCFSLFLVISILKYRKKQNALHCNELKYCFILKWIFEAVWHPWLDLKDLFCVLVIGRVGSPAL